MPEQTGQNRVINSLGIFIVCVATMLVAGCGGSSIERCVVTGKVTVDGQPIEEGEIHFVPIKGTKGPVWAAYITNGEYSAHGKGGVPVGELRVEIDAWKLKQVNYGKDEFGDMGDGIERTSIIPVKYSGRHSPLTITIPPGAGEIVKDFNIES